MTTIPLLGGFIQGPNAEFVASPPVNLEPVVFDTNNGIAEGQLRAMPGAAVYATGPGVDRGGVVYGNAHIRVMGTSLVKVEADNVTTLGDVGGTGPVTFDYGFDRLGIRSGTTLYYWTGTALVAVTDPDLGPVKDMLWVDGYYMTTDGTSIIVSDLADPTSVDPLRYGSAEEDPDMVTGLLKFRGEIFALGRHTIEVFQNVGRAVFPFAKMDGATIPYGCVSASAKCLFAESFAFVGSARGEALGVYVAGSGSAVKISDKALDDALAAEDDPTAIELESRTYGDERRLFVHLAASTRVYFLKASRQASRPVWCIAKSGTSYRLRNAVEYQGRLYVGDKDSAAVGALDESIGDHFGDVVEWQFDTAFMYNKGAGAIVNEAELIGLPGVAPFASKSSAFLSCTDDGKLWSPERSCPMAASGSTVRQLIWRPRRRMRKFMGLRFRGYGLAVPGFASLEIEADGLSA